MKPKLDRLQKLADHLREGNLGHKIFDFARYNNIILPRCGTAGCGIGECPIVFPDNWKFDNGGNPILKGSRTKSTKLSGIYYFGITDEEYSHLFEPDHQSVSKLYYTTMLSINATKEQVAENMQVFIDYHKNN